MKIDKRPASPKPPRAATPVSAGPARRARAASAQPTGAGSGLGPLATARPMLRRNHLNRIREPLAAAPECDFPPRCRLHGRPHSGGDGGGGGVQGVLRVATSRATPPEDAEPIHDYRVKGGVFQNVSSYVQLALPTIYEVV